MTTETTATATATTFSSAEQEALVALQRRFAPHHDLFSEQELAYLRFLRWLYETGRLPS